MPENRNFKPGTALRAADVQLMAKRSRGTSQVQRGFSDGVRSYGGSKKTAHPWTMQGIPNGGEDIPPFSVFGMKGTAAQESVGVVKCQIAAITGTDSVSAFAMYTNDSIGIKNGKPGTIRPISLGFPIVVRAYEPEPEEGEDPPADESPQVGRPCGLMRGTYEFTRHRGGFWCTDKFVRTIDGEEQTFYVVFLTQRQEWYGITTTTPWSSTGPINVLVTPLDSATSEGPGFTAGDITLKCCCPPLGILGGYEYASPARVRVCVDPQSGRFIIDQVYGCPVGTLAE